MYGLRLRLVHGHLLGRQPAWKAWMESRAFFAAFATCPGRSPGCSIERCCPANRAPARADEERHLRVYRDYAAGLQASPIS